MAEWIRQVFDAPEFGVLVLPAGLLLGLITALGTVCCSAPMIAAIVGYAGTREDSHRRSVVAGAACFMLGTVISLSAAGGLIGYLGQAAGSSLGMYGKMLVGIVTVLFGFAALGLLPVRIPAFSPAAGRLPQGLLGASVFGLAVGGASVAYTMACCGPVLLPVVLGLSALRGEGLWGALILAMFAVGYSLPMVAAMAGVGLGKLSSIASKVAGPVRLASGILLLGVGFWLLLTL